MKFLLIAFIFLGYFTTCKEEVGSKLDQIIVYSADGVDIVLDNVRDSRCPTDATCVWEGNVIVDMILLKADEQEPFTLHSAAQEGPQEMKVLDVNVKLIDIKPYPVSAQREYELSEYEVELEVQ